MNCSTGERVRCIKCRSLLMLSAALTLVAVRSDSTDRAFGRIESEVVHLTEASSREASSAAKKTSNPNTKCSGKYPSAWMDQAKPCCDQRIGEVKRRWEILPEHAVVSFRPGGPKLILLDAWQASSGKEAVYFVSGRNATFDQNEDEYHDFSTGLNFSIKYEFGSVKGLVACKTGEKQTTNPEEIQEYEKMLAKGDMSSRFWNQFHYIVTCELPADAQHQLNVEKEGITTHLGEAVTSSSWPAYELCPRQLTNNRVASKTRRKLTYCTALNPFWKIDETDSGELLRSVKWIEYMLLMGVEHIFVYMISRQPCKELQAAGNEMNPAYERCVRGSEGDATVHYGDEWKVLSKFVEAGTVTLMPWPYSPYGFEMVLSFQSLIDHCNWMQKGEVDWVGFAQVDEFFQPMGLFTDLQQVVGQAKYNGVHNLELYETVWGPKDLEWGKYGTLQGFTSEIHQIYPRCLASAEAGGRVTQAWQCLNFSGCLVYGNPGESNFRSIASNAHFVSADSVHHNNNRFASQLSRDHARRPDPVTEVRQNHFSSGSGNGLWNTCQNDFFHWKFDASDPSVSATWLTQGDATMRAQLPCMDIVGAAGAVTKEALACRKKQWQAVKLGCVDWKAEAERLGPKLNANYEDEKRGLYTWCGGGHDINDLGEAEQERKEAVTSCCSCHHDHGKPQCDAIKDEAWFKSHCDFECNGKG